MRWVNVKNVGKELLCGGIFAKSVQAIITWRK